MLWALPVMWQSLLRLYKEYAVEYHIKCNHLKSKPACYNSKNVKDVSIQLFGQNIEAVDDVLYLGNYISNYRWRETILKCFLLLIQ